MQIRWPCWDSASRKEVGTPSVLPQSPHLAIIRLATIKMGTFETNLQWHEVKGFGVSKSGPRSEPESQLLRHWDWRHVAKLGPPSGSP